MEQAQQARDNRRLGLGLVGALAVFYVIVIIGILVLN